MTDSLFDAARACLDASGIEEKPALTLAMAEAFAGGELSIPDDAPAPEPIRMPGRPARPTLVHPRELPRRGFGSDEGRAAFIHAVAHIEFNAIDLAWDAVYRFRGMPAAYYRDWAQVADDEARTGIDGFAVAALEVVEHDDVVAVVAQQFGRDAADVAGSACQHNFHPNGRFTRPPRPEQSLLRNRSAARGFLASAHLNR